MSCIENLYVFNCPIDGGHTIRQLLEYQLSFHYLAFSLTSFAARTTPAAFALFARSYSNTLHHPLYETLHG